MNAQGTEFVLTLDGDDRRGIVAAVAGVLAELGCTIRDSQQFGEADLDRFFMRVEFDSEVGTLDRHLLANAISAAVRPFGMKFSLSDRGLAHRLLVMVSKDGHC